MAGRIVAWRWTNSCPVLEMICALREGEEQVVADALVAALDTARKRSEPSGRKPARRRAARFERLVRRPD